MKPSITRSVWIALLIGVSLFLGCNKKSPTPTGIPITPTVSLLPTVEGTPTTVPTRLPLDADAITVVVADPITSLEPFRMIRVHPDESVAVLLWDTLTRIGDDLQLEPHIAQSWRVINNFTWEFALREGIRFHNGEPVDAYAVRFSIERAQTMRESLEVVVYDLGLDRVEIVDQYTLRIVTVEPVSNLPYALASLEILPPAYYSQGEPEELAAAPVGSGPYRLLEWSPGEEIVLEAVSSYWGGAPRWKQIVFRSVPGVEDRLAMLGDGQATLVTDLPPMRIADWNVDHAQLRSTESTQRMLIGMHVSPGFPLDDKRVRQALNYGVDVGQIVEDLLAGYGARYGSWVNPPSGDETLAPWPYDPDKARALLKEAGYSEGLQLALHVPRDVYFAGTEIAQAIAAQLGEIGVQVNVVVAEWPVYVQSLLSRHPPSLFLLAVNSRGNGVEDVRNLSADFAFNPTHWQSDLFQQKVQRASSSFNEITRSRLLDEAQALAYEAAPWIWLWRSYDFYGVASDLDWTPRADGLVDLYQTDAQVGD